MGFLDRYQLLKSSTKAKKEVNNRNAFQCFSTLCKLVNNKMEKSHIIVYLNNQHQIFTLVSCSQQKCA